ncbi:MAG: TetR/AcrR family transcriptional regulator [Deltaproteobacteria bacterium]|nr:TetR/AcrR family transcriptional regulator [Deltaproteobacteria bacterium]
MRMKQVPKMKSSNEESQVKNEKRDAILHAAWGLIRHYGYSKTTIDDIAKRAKVGKGTVYLYFKSKTEIMLALTDLTNQRITRELERIASENKPPQERLRACVLYRVMTLFDLVNRYPHSEDVIASILPEIVERLDRYVRRHGELLGQIVREGCSSGMLVSEDPELTGQLLASLFEFLTPPYYRFKSRKSLEQFTGEIVDLMLNGLKKKNS